MLFSKFRFVLHYISPPRGLLSTCFSAWVEDCKMEIVEMWDLPGPAFLDPYLSIFCGLWKD